MSAAEFVSLADVSGLAVPLGQWTLRGACQQGRKWHDAGHDALVVSVNISVKQLAHAALVKLVRRVLDETRLPASCLEIEVSEADLVRGPELAIERLEELRRIGLRIALDDFGTGESRIAHLYRYPIDTLKIDGSVVRDAVTNRDHEAVIIAAVALARSRRLAVVAEGVESEAQRVHARALAVRPDAGQPLGPARDRGRGGGPAAAPAPRRPRPAGRGRPAAAAALEPRSVRSGRRAVRANDPLRRPFCVRLPFQGRQSVCTSSTRTGSKRTSPAPGRSWASSGRSAVTTVATFG